MENPDISSRPIGTLVGKSQTSQSIVHPPSKIADLNRHLIRGLLDTPKFTSQTASKTVPPFLHSSHNMLRATSPAIDHICALGAGDVA